MFEAVHVFLYDNSVWVILIALSTGVWQGRVAWFAWLDLQQRVEERRQVTRQLRRGAKPPTAAQQVLTPDTPASLQAGVSGHAQKGGAKTERLPAMPGDGDDEPSRHTTELGAVLDVRRRATRMEELGFHHTIPADEPTAPATAPAAAVPPGSPLAPDGAPTVDGGAPALDDILARLDQMLAEDASPAPSAAAAPAADTATTVVPPTPAAAAPAPTPSPAPAAKAPLWARADVLDDDLPADNEPPPGRQLGLFDEIKDDDFKR